MKELRLFLGLANYYRRFVEGYSRKATPLTGLLKKGVTWEWTDKCQKAFDELKTTIMKGLVLALLDISKPFEVQTLLWEGCFCKRVTPWHLRALSILR